MSDYHETFVLGLEPAYHVSCKFCGVDVYGRSGKHTRDCPRSDYATQEVTEFAAKRPDE